MIAQSGTVRISIVNTLGATVWSAELDAEAGLLQRSIDVGGLPSGSYTLDVRFGTGTNYSSQHRSKHFVKE
jgi:hypothetical protein